MLWWTRRKLRSPDPWRRVQALTELSESAAPEAVELMLASLRDPDLTVQRAAVSSLDRVPDPDGRIARTFESVLADRNSGIHAEVNSVLGARETSSAVGIAELVELLVDPAERVRRAAQNRLERALPGGSTLVTKLVRALGRKDSDYIESDVVEALRPYAGPAELARIRDLPRARAFSTLLEALRKSGDTERAAAARQLGETGKPEAVEALIAALKDESACVREAAAQALGRVGTQQTMAALVPTLQDQAWSVRERAIEALWELGWQPENDAQRAVLAVARGWAEVAHLGPIAAGPVMEAFQADYHRVKAARILGRIREREAVEPLLNALSDQDDELRAVAAEALGLIADPRAAAPLAHLAAANDKLRDVATSALRNVGQASAEALGELLDDPCFEACEIAAAVLRSLAWEPADDRQRALWAVASRQWDQAVGWRVVAVEPLIVALRHAKAYEVRVSAAKALGAIGDRRAIVPLILALVGAVEIRPGVRIVDPCEPAREALERIDRYWPHSEEASGTVPLIAGLLKEGLAGHAAAAQALGKIGNGGSFELLLRLSEDVEVAKTAVEGLVAVLRRSRSQISEEGLRAASVMKNVVQAGEWEQYSVIEGRGWDSAGMTREMTEIDCSEVRERAQAELARRRV